MIFSKIVMRTKPAVCFLALGCELRYNTADRARARLGLSKLKEALVALSKDGSVLRSELTLKYHSDISDLKEAFDVRCLKMSPCCAVSWKALNLLTVRQ